MIYIYPTDKFIYTIGLASSITEAKRLRKAGVVELNGEKLTEAYLALWKSSTNSKG